ncbi:anti-sigma factor [Candidatus Woesebacteria bacterium]|nr:anti-sigma factor [Candidatus Woesebacteria bacterium]
MRTRDIVIGLIILAVIAGAIVWIRRTRTQEEPLPTPSIEEKIEKTFNLEIPDDVERADLRDVSGGTGSGIATRKYQGGTFTHAVLADLPDPAAGYFYEGWLVRGKEGEANFAFISTGRMRVAKGGYLLEFNSSTDYSPYSGVVVTLERVDDRKPETHILEGSFQ